MNPPFNRSVHFDLGVDTLASTQEMLQLADPWIPAAVAAPDPLAPYGMPLPTEDLGNWAARLQLPGI